MLTVLLHWRALRRWLSLGCWINCRGYNWFPWLSITTEHFQWRPILAEERQAGMDGRRISGWWWCVFGLRTAGFISFLPPNPDPIRGLGRLSPSTMVNWNVLLWVRLESDHGGLPYNYEQFIGKICMLCITKTNHSVHYSFRKHQESCEQGQGIFWLVLYYSVIYLMSQYESHFWLYCGIA